ncbi:MAG: tyrosine-type recombinase/integrase, partial [Acidobacteriota bacterium]
YGKKWLKEIKKTKLARATIQSYERNLNNHLIPHFGKKRIDAIDYQAVKGFVVTMADAVKPSRSKDKKRKGTERYSKDSIRIMVATLRLILTEAAREGLIAANPVQGVGKFYSGSPTKRKIDPFTPKELEKIHKVAAKRVPEYHDFILSMSEAGLRVGESMARKVTDLDFRKYQIVVDSGINSGEYLGEIGETKTEASNRRVDMSRRLEKALKALLRRRAEAKLRGKLQPELLFTIGGKQIEYSHFHDAWKRILTLAKVRYRNPHQLRHSWISILLSRGAPIPYVSNQAGHKDPSITLRLYAKWIPRKGSRDNLDLLRPESENPRNTGVDRSEASSWE